LSPEQVVAIADNGGGRQALEMVQRLLPVLCREHGLTPAQVVAIGSYDGGKQALEAVQRLLPVLCNDYRLTSEQVVAIASNSGGKQALERVFAQLSCPDPALAALSNDRLAALACLGGRPAVDAVSKGLPHAPILIRRANRRVPERAFQSVADPAQIVQVLSFFQCHSHPEQAFDEAMKQFGLSRSGLLQLFRRVGVTELEARSGMLPSASQRWRRILQALGARPAAASASFQDSGQAFADSLERELDAPSPLHEAGAPEQPDALHAHLPSGWGLKRRRTKFGHGLTDPGTPTDADLAASSIAFQRQEPTLVALAETDFPAFNEEEIEWLMELLPN